MEAYSVAYAGTVYETLKLMYCSSLVSIKILASTSHC